MSQLFDRKVKLVLASNLDPEKWEVDGRFFRAFTRETTIGELRMAFRIEKSLKKQPNKCEITINNLVRRTRAEFQTSPAHIAFSAGYAGTVKQLYKGDILYAPSRKEGTEWLTEVQAGTGAQAFRHGRVSQTFKAGTDLKTLVVRAAKSMGLSVPKSIQEGKEMLSKIRSGVTLDGLSHREMSRLLDAKGLGWSVQDDQLQIIRDGDTNKAQAIVISPELGMIGSPEMGTPEAKGKAPILKVKTLLDGDITPGGLLQVNSRDITGNFKILRVIHVGDTHGQPWYSEVEARAL